MGVFQFVFFLFEGYNLAIYFWGFFTFFKTKSVLIFAHMCVLQILCDLDTDK